MSWFPRDVGKAVKVSDVGSGRLLLARYKDGKRLAVAIDQVVDSERGFVVFDDDGTSAITYAQNVAEWAWDISDNARIEPALEHFSMNDDAPGCLARKDGPYLISFDAGGGMQPNVKWLNLETFKIDGVGRSVRFPHWRVIAIETDETLFRWSPG